MAQENGGAIVLDTNVIVYFFLHGPFAKEADELQERDFEWTAPPL